MESHRAGSAPAPLRGLVDGLGQRVVTRTTSGARFEALRLSAAFAGGTRFEREVRETLASIARFSHPAFPPAPRIERLSAADGRPVLVSAYEPGQRLVTLLRRARDTGRTFTTSTTLFIVRDTLQALRSAHSAVPGFFHGALGPERIVVTPDLRVVVVEHVLGRALSATLPSDPAELWRRFGLAVPADPTLPAFGPETDQLQIGLVALALLLGRPLAAEDYPDRVAALADEARETDLLGRPSPLGPALREWLSRLLFVSTNGPYPDLQAAEDDLAILLSDEGGYVAAPIGFEVEPEVLEELPVRQASREGVLRQAPSADTPSVEAPPAHAQPGRSHLRLVEPEPLAEPDATAQPAAQEHVEAPPRISLSFSEDGQDPAHPAGGAVLLESPHAAVERAIEAAASQAAGRQPAPILEPVEPVELSAFRSQQPAGDHASSSGVAAKAHDEKIAPRAIESETARGSDGVFPAPPQPAPDSGSAKHGDPHGLPPVRIGPRLVPTPDHSLLHLAGGVGAVPAGEAGIGDSMNALVSHGAENAGVPEPGGEVLAPARSPRTRRIPTRLLIVAASVAVLLTTGIVAGGYYFLAGGGPPGRLHLASVPAGASVLLEGRPLGKTPVSVDLSPGVHYVEIRGQHSSYTLSVQIRSRKEVRERVSLPEAGKPATLVVRTEPPGVPVMLDGQSRGEGPLTLAAVPPGQHVIVAANEVGRIERELMLSPGGRFEVTLAVSGWIEVDSALPVQTSVDGRVVRSPGPIALTPGRHRVEFVNGELGLRDAQDVIVEAGRTTTVVVSGTTGGLDLTADVPAEVFIDGRPAGRTPLLNLTLPLGKHEVRLSNPTLGDVRYEVAIRPGTNSLHGTFGAAPARAPRPPPPRRVR